MALSRSLLVAVSLCGLVAPARGSAQSAPFERRPFVVVNGGYGAQGSGESSTREGGPQVSVGGGERSAPGATIGFGFGLRAAPRTDRAVRLEARYTALTHAVAATHGIVGLGLGLWL